MRYIFDGDEEWIKATIPHTATLVINFVDITGLGEKKAIIASFGHVKAKLYKQKDTYVFAQKVKGMD